MDLDDVIDGSVAAVCDDDLPELASTLGRFLGAERSLVFHYPQEGFPSFLPSDLASEMRGGYGPGHLETDPIHPWMHGLSPRLVVTTESLDRRAFVRSFAYRDFYRRVGAERLLGVWLTDGRYGHAGMLGILLTKRGEPFDRARAAKLELARSNLRGVARRLEKTRALREEADVGRALLASGQHEHAVLLDAAGRVRFCGAGAEGHLSRWSARALSAAAREVCAGALSTDARWVKLGPTATASLVTLPGLAGGPWVLATVHPVTPEQPALTPAELRVLRCLDETGGTNAELARHLGVATETVRTHLKRLFAKLDARNRTQALARARERGLLAPL